MTLMRKLTKKETDILKEVANMGAGYGAATLSDLIKKKITMTVPSATVTTAKGIGKVVADQRLVKKGLVVASFVPIAKMGIGNLMVVLPKKDALILVDILNGRKPGTSTLVDDIAASTIKEVMNITAGSYLSAFGKFLKRSFVHGMPRLVCTVIQELPDFISLGITDRSQPLLAIKTILAVSSPRFRVEFILLIGIQSTDNLFPVTTSPAAKGTILLVDDSDFMRTILIKQLKKAGYSHFLQASSGKEALFLYKKKKPDLVLMDVIMPGMITSIKTRSCFFFL